MQFISASGAICFGRILCMMLTRSVHALQTPTLPSTCLACCAPGAQQAISSPDLGGVCASSCMYPPTSYHTLPDVKLFTSLVCTHKNHPLLDLVKSSRHLKAKDNLTAKPWAVCQHRAQRLVSVIYMICCYTTCAAEAAVDCKMIYLNLNIGRHA